ncbi:MAG: outer membrane protein assembly factor BamE, partial [Elioraea tepidiphila]
MEPPARPVNAARRRRLPAAALSLLLLAGCSVFETPADRRGQRVDAEDLAQLVPGTSTRADVLALLGTPSATGTFDGEHWYYISAVTRACRRHATRWSITWPLSVPISAS